MIYMKVAPMMESVPQTIFIYKVYYMYIVFI